MFPIKTLLAGVVCLAMTGAAAANPARWQSEWPETNFDKTTVASWGEILSGGPPKDGIPALFDPRFISVG